MRFSELIKTLFIVSLLMILFPDCKKNPVKVSRSSPKNKESIFIGRFTPLEMGKKSKWSNYSFLGAVRKCWGSFDSNIFNVDNKTGFYTFKLPVQTKLEEKYGQPFKELKFVCNYDRGNGIYNANIPIVEKRFVYLPDTVLVIPELIFDYTSEENYFPENMKTDTSQEAFSATVREFQEKYPERSKGIQFDIFGVGDTLKKNDI